MTQGPLSPCRRGGSPLRTRSWKCAGLQVTRVPCTGGPCMDLGRKVVGGVRKVSPAHWHLTPRHMSCHITGVTPALHNPFCVSFQQTEEQPRKGRAITCFFLLTFDWSWGKTFCCLFGHLLWLKLCVPILTQKWTASLISSHKRGGGYRGRLHLFWLANHAKRRDPRRWEGGRTHPPPPWQVPT